MTRAARLLAHGSPLVVEDVPLSELGPDEVLVELAFGGVNPIDRYVAQGWVAPEGQLPRTAGGEASGTVDGQPVLVTGGGLGAVRDGVWAGQAVVPAGLVVPVPQGISLEQAAATGIAGLTAYSVVELAKVTAEDTVLVLGASGGVGLALVGYVAKLGATVIGQTGSAGKAARITEAGAHQVLVGDAASVSDIAPTVVFDALGGGFTRAALDVLQPRGRLVLFGVSAGAEADVNWQVLYRKSIHVLGYGGLQVTPAERRVGLKQTLAAMAEGLLTITVDRVLPLEQVNDAFTLLTDRSLTGKVLLDLR